MKVLALGIDAPNHDLLTRWLDEGRLPCIASLLARGRCTVLESEKAHSNEHSWIPALTGRGRRQWDHWLDRWEPSHYDYHEASLFDWLRAPVFYALGDSRRVVAFDLAAPVVEGVSGVQVCGFAAELNESFPQSQPPGLIDELTQRLGPDPKAATPQRIFNGVSGREGISWTVPCAYDRDGMREFAGAMLRSVERRTQACLELMAREPWDLFIAAYTEAHTAGHILWHLSQPHPLSVLRGDDADPVLATYQAIDRSVATLAQAAGEDVAVVFFTLDATVADSLENARVVFLPEFLHRWNFGGRAALAEGDMAASPPAPTFHYRRHWKHEVWDLRTAAGEATLESPEAQQARSSPLSWCPANWYRPLWPRMKAFALPSVADGYVRINVKGRESQGRVDANEFRDLCDELARSVATLRDARTGKPIVRTVERVRDDPFDADPKKPPADLIVIFHEDGPLDVVDSPLVGRIGPVPYFRSSSHQSHGAVLRNLLCVSRPGGPAQASDAVGRLEDIPVTILDVLGLGPRPGMDGVSRA